jgi:hypothetical protein
MAMADMQMRFVDDLKAQGRKGARQLFANRLFDRH